MMPDNLTQKKYSFYWNKLQFYDGLCYITRLYVYNYSHGNYIVYKSVCVICAGADVGRWQGVAVAAAVLNTNRTDFKPLSEFITAIEMRQMLKYFCIQAKTCMNINIC